MSKDKESKKFIDIQTPEEMRLYLNSADRLDNSNYLYHYTSVQAVSKIIETKMLYLRRAEDMNDKLEYDNGDKLLWKNLFFSSFMGEEEENIGMWSMYAQPWEKGVKISIPKNKFRSWIKGTNSIYEIKDLEKGKIGKIIYKDADSLTMRISAVAYYRSLQNEGEKAEISWSNRTNRNIDKKLMSKELTEYLKDKAWSYEKEIRIKAEFDNKSDIRCVAIPLTEEVIKSIKVIASPLFKGDLKSILEKQTQRSIDTDKSMFTDKLKIYDICENCEYKNDVHKR